MFQFPGFALISLWIQPISTWLRRLSFDPHPRRSRLRHFAGAERHVCEANNRMHSGGFPHSEISGSKPIPGSPKLIAGYRVLHRLLLPRHPPNALIALDLTRKKKDPHRCGVRPVPRRDRPTSFQISMQLFPPSSEDEDLVSVLDLDNAAVGCFQPPHPHSGAADNADNLSERCEGSGSPAAMRPTGRESDQTLSDQVGKVMVEPDGVEPTTSCLQSRRSTN